MASILIGGPSSGEKVLRKSSFTKEKDGLILLTENYTVQKSDSKEILAGIQTGATHSSISTDSPTYSTLFVESSRIDPMDGGLDSLTINYAGLFSDTLPPAYIEYVGNPGAGIYGPDLSIVVSYVTNEDISVIIGQANPLGNIQLQAQTVIVGEVTYLFPSLRIRPPTGRLMPPQINGISLPDSPSPRVWGSASNPDTLEFDFYIYAGYCQSQFSSTKRGTFYQIQETFTEWAYGTERFYDRFNRFDIGFVSTFEPQEDENF